MFKLSKILRENIEQHKRKVYLKAAIDMATAYSRRGYTQDEAIKDAAKGIENVYGYVLTPQDIQALKHFVPENPQFKESVVKSNTNTFQKDWNAWLDQVINYLIGLKYNNSFYYNGGMLDYIESFSQWWDDDQDNFDDDHLELFYDKWEKLIGLAKADKKSLNTLDDYIEFFNKAKEL
jgi:hypothetical protein